MLPPMTDRLPNRATEAPATARMPGSERARGALAVHV